MSKKKWIVWAILLCITITAGYFGLRASAASTEIIECDIPAEYVRGAEFVMPEGRVSYKGQSITPENKYVVFPSGKAKTGDKLILSEAGKYTLVFQAKVDGALISAKKEFVVQKALVQVNNENSTANVADGKIEVSLAPDDVFTYNAVLDLTDASKSTPLLNMQFIPAATGTADATNVKIRFTDLYDENNYITVSLNHFTGAWASGHIYVTAGAAQQPQVGVENAGNPDGMQVHKDDYYGYGAAINCSLSGLPKTPADSFLTMYFDYAEKALYADRETYSGINQLITDLDDPAYYGDNTWSGFTTGEVKMTVFATNYQSAACNFVISEIGGVSEFVDTGDVYAPVVSVDTGYAPDEIPTALEGRPYPVFAARAVDGYDGTLPVVTTVYYRYYSERPVEIPVTDGKFTPTDEGVYVIEYTATDASGNVGTQCVTVNAVSGEGLQAQVLDAATEVDTGVAVKVFSEVVCTNVSGNVAYTVKAKDPATGEETEIDNQTLTFVPMREGDWQIIVTVSDYVCTVEKTFMLKVNHTDQPQVYDDAGVPEYFILGATYRLPALQGYDFSSGQGELTEMTLFVKEEGGQEQKVEQGRYIPENPGAVTLTYRLTAGDKVCEKTYNATVVDTGYTADLDLSKYFAVASGAAAAQADTAAITYEMKEDTKLDFVNFVQVKEMSFSFQVGEQNAYNKVHIYLTDIITGKQLKFSYSRTEAGAGFSINDGAQTALTSGFEGINKNFSLEFYNDTGIVSPEVGIEVEVKKFLDGSDFDGFTDTVARFSVEVEEVSGLSQIVVKNVNGHTMNNATMDRFSPQIIVDTMSGDRGLGDKVTLPGAFAYDVLDPVCALTLDVTDAGGAYVTDVNGVVLDGAQDPGQDYTFTIDALGDYVIQYTMTDGNGKNDYYVYAITAKDVAGPEISLLKHTETAKAGEAVAVAEAEVTDNITAECTVAVYVFNPCGVSVKVTDGKFNAELPGVYDVRYMAFDEDGNYAFASYEINVK